MAVRLELQLDPRGSRRRALEVALRTAIRERRLAAGFRLPSTRALADDLGLARGTVVEAYAQLQAEGYITARHGAGTWVADLKIAAPSLESGGRAPSRLPRFAFKPGLPDLAAFPRAAWATATRRSLGGMPASTLGYGDSRGHAELRAALAEYVARARGAIADPELIVVCAGFVHGLSLLSRVLRARGVERIAMEDPCHWWHREVAEAAGLQLVPLPVDERGARTDLLADSGAGAAFLAPAHQFPLGAVLHPERRTLAIEWARTSGGIVIEDDYDAELRYDRQPIGALQALDPEHVVYAGTASKTLAPGLRLGWLLLPKALCDPLLVLRFTEDVHVPIPHQLAFAELMRSGAFERHVRRMRSRYRARRDRLLAMLAERAPRATIVGIEAGLRILLELPDDAPSGDELAASALEQSIELFPVTRCYVDRRPLRDGLVIGYAALPEHDFESALAALGDFLEQSLPR
jgi:GntR family transcriptional regulator / MocR family aminotransferase